MALPFRGIQRQSNITTCVEQQQKSNKLTWQGMAQTTERKLFSNPEPQYLARNTETQLPSLYFK